MRRLRQWTLRFHCWFVKGADVIAISCLWMFDPWKDHTEECFWKPIFGFIGVILNDLIVVIIRPFSIHSPHFFLYPGFTWFSTFYPFRTDTVQNRQPSFVYMILLKKCWWKPTTCFHVLERCISLSLKLISSIMAPDPNFPKKKSHSNIITITKTKTSISCSFKYKFCSNINSYLHQIHIH